MAHTTRDEAKTFLGISTTEDDTLLDGLVATAQQMVDHYCQRTFEAAADETRYFDACYPTIEERDLFLHTDLCAISSVVNGDGMGVAAGSYVTIPDEPPYYALSLKLASGLAWTHADAPELAIAITGRWAYSATPPAPIVHATKEMDGWLYKSYDRYPAARGSKAELEDELPPVVRAILNSYRRF